MSYSDTLFNQLVEWVKYTRQQSARLNIEADGILTRLITLSSQQQHIHAISHSPLTLGLYGNSVAGKNHLLKMVLAESRDEIYIQLGEHTINYLRHINPDNIPVSMAIRFTHTAQPEAENFPVLLTLFSESELAQRLIHQYHSSAHACVAGVDSIVAIIAELKPHCQPHTVPGMTCEEMSTVIQYYHRHVGDRHLLDDGLVCQIVEMASGLSVANRARLLSAFWGEQLTLSSIWQQQAQILHFLGNTSQLLAPVSLIIDNLLQKNNSFLFHGHVEDIDQNNDIIVCPLLPDQQPTQMSIAQRDLASICAEITFRLLPKASVKELDIIDIPNGQLSYYQNRLQPDTLLICNVAAENANPLPVARKLVDWAKQTQCLEQRTLPRLVWGITPFDQRFTKESRIDNVVQHYITQSGISWGTLQALNHRDITSLHEWLSAAISRSARETRLSLLQKNINRQMATLFCNFNSQDTYGTTGMQEQAEALVRTLQSQAEKHGELIDRLILSRDTLQQGWMLTQQKAIKPSGKLKISINLFDDAENDVLPQGQIQSFGQKVFSLWVSHLCRLSQKSMSLAFSWLPQAQFQTLCTILIDTAYRIGLPQTLEKTLAPYSNNASMAITCASNVIGDYISWLGYDAIDQKHRPASRIVKGACIFAPAPQADARTRITRLGSDILQDNARYIFDWMVALLARAAESGKHGRVTEIDEQQRVALLSLLQRE